MTSPDTELADKIAALEAQLQEPIAQIAAIQLAVEDIKAGVVALGGLVRELSETVRDD